ncbi:MAG: lamin tail domain-containing protein [Candidatus Microsaccharimonas sp.]
MLKKLRVLFLGLVVLAGSACVTPTHASSAFGVVISRVQAAGPSGAKEELIVLHNNSATEVDVTGWCLVNKAGIEFICLEINNSITAYAIAPYSSISIASNEFVASSGHNNDYFPFIYTVTNQSSGSIVTSSDTISLFNAENKLVDVKSWSSSISAGKVWSRVQLTATILLYADTNMPVDWVLENASPAPASMLVIDLSEGGDEGTIEAGEEELESQPPGGDTAIELHDPLITEILANPTGIDTGKEFIELYNPNTEDAVILNPYTLLIGASSFKSYSFPAGALIEPLGYATFYDTDLGFTLNNTAGRIQLKKGDKALDQVVEYASSKEGLSWALIDQSWQYTEKITAGFLNLATPIKSIEVIPQQSSQPKPCAENQFRNPETGRCKLIATATSSLAPCKVGQERNVDTNRCRNVSTGSSTLTPCNAGQERNPETNRCRNLSKISDSDYGVKGITTEQGSEVKWYYWLAIAGVITTIIGYGVWEWRQELSVVYKRLVSRFAKRLD